MEYDAQKAVRVWQRVQGEKQETTMPQSGDHIPALILEQRELAAAYLQLAQRLSGKEMAILQRLSREAQAQTACLKGMCLLTIGQVPENRVTAAQRSGSDAALRRCYGKELGLLKEYENRRDDPEYGPVFERLADYQREHCRTVLELLGRLGRNGGSK